MTYQGNTEEHLNITTVTKDNCHYLKESAENELSLLWFTKEGNELIIDGMEHSFFADQIVCLTEFHNVAVKKITEVRLIRFNRPFFCIKEHDSEVGCKGILFFGASNLPVIHIPAHEVRSFEIVYEMFVMELNTQDSLQLEMLQMMLKRFLILCTRLYRSQVNYDTLPDQQADIVREYNYLIEQHFKTKHTVAEYADLLNKSPKTLSNLFARLSHKTPLEYIHERRMLEARRQLSYTDKSVKEIAFELGFEDTQAFGRFFKNRQGCSPSVYREQE